MNYYELNKDKLLGKVRDRYHNSDGKEKATKYYKNNQEVLKENAIINYRKLSEGKKEIKRAYGRNRYGNIKQNKEYFHLYGI